MKMEKIVSCDDGQATNLVSLVFHRYSHAAARGAFELRSRAL